MQLGSILHLSCAKFPAKWIWLESIFLNRCWSKKILTDPNKKVWCVKFQWLIPSLKTKIEKYFSMEFLVYLDWISTKKKIKMLWLEPMKPQFLELFTNQHNMWIEKFIAPQKQVTVARISLDCVDQYSNYWLVVTTQKFFGCLQKFLVTLTEIHLNKLNICIK